MNRFPEYLVFFIVLSALQVFLFDNLMLSTYITPLVYIAFIIVLPLGISFGALLLLGFITGIIMDFCMGTAGLNTIASLTVSFARPAIANMTLGKAQYRESDMPLPSTYGNARWLRYASTLVAIHCVIFFMFEAASFSHIGFMLLRMLCSAVATTIVVFFAGKIYPYKSSRRRI